MDNWTLNSFDNTGAIVNSGPYFGTAAMVTGPATPPLGTGSAELATPTGAGDGAAAIATEQFDGTKLSSITSLSYSAYDAVNNGQQFPYLAVSVDLGSPAGGGADAGLDTLFFEPPYQTPSTGNASLSIDQATAQDEWQSWDAYIGGFWDNNSIFTPGTGVGSLADFLALYPNATIENGGFTGLGGIALQVGFGSSGETEVGYVDDFSIGINGAVTDYNFDPAAATPLPASIWGAGVLMMGLAGWKWRQGRQTAI
jgi:hypothetical protein